MQEQVVHKKVAEILALEHLFSKLLDTSFLSYLFFFFIKVVPFNPTGARNRITVQPVK